jgi:uncharacterized iron-regulated protein
VNRPTQRALAARADAGRAVWVGLAWVLVAWVLWAGGCAVVPSQPHATAPTAAALPAAVAKVIASDAAPPSSGPAWLLLGEQHDAAAHHALHAQTLQHLVTQGRLGAVVLEMAERGHDTRALPRSAPAPTVRQALAWDAAAWPWDAYAPAVMAAVQSGVPVWGGNLPRQHMRQAMANGALDASVPPTALTRLDAAMDAGHCGLLPPERWRSMARIQIARDREMAHTLLQALAHARATRGPQAVVVLITGATHADRSLGVPLHLQAMAPSESGLSLAWRAQGKQADPQARYDLTWLTPAPPERDPCAGLRERFGTPPTHPSNAAPNPTR